MNKVNSNQLNFYKNRSFLRGKLLSETNSTKLANKRHKMTENFRSLVTADNKRAHQLLEFHQGLKIHSLKWRENVPGNLSHTFLLLNGQEFSGDTPWCSFHIPA